VRIELQQAQGQLANNARSTVLQGIGGLVLVVGAIATWRQLHVSREGQITERFTRAVDQLGSPNADVRVGGIYALERIARDSAADRISIQFLMGAFVRNRAGQPENTQGDLQLAAETIDDQMPLLRARAPDVQVAMAVLGRRLPPADSRAVTLSRADLRGLVLKDARSELRSVWLENADLTAADLRQASLEDSHLNGADLRHANLRDANLRGADLRGANLTGAILERTVLTNAKADAATTWSASLDARTRQDLGIIDAGGDLLA
jgi:hypothetical protein